MRDDRLERSKRSNKIKELRKENPEKYGNLTIDQKFTCDLKNTSLDPGYESDPDYEERFYTTCEWDDLHPQAPEPLKAWAECIHQLNVYNYLPDDWKSKQDWSHTLQLELDKHSKGMMYSTGDFPLTSYNILSRIIARTHEPHIPHFQERKLDHDTMAITTLTIPDKADRHASTRQQWTDALKLLQEDVVFFEDKTIDWKIQSPPGYATPLLKDEPRAGTKSRKDNPDNRGG